MFPIGEAILCPRNQVVSNTRGLVSLGVAHAFLFKGFLEVQIDGIDFNVIIAVFHIYLVRDLIDSLSRNTDFLNRAGYPILYHCSL